MIIYLYPTNIIINKSDMMIKLNVKNIDYELIVIDNNSNDNTRTICNEFSSKINLFKYFLEKKQGLSHARNRGIEESSGDIITSIGILDLLYNFPHFPSKKSLVLIRAIFFDTLNKELAN